MPIRACGSGWRRRCCRFTCSPCSLAWAWPGRSPSSTSGASGVSGLAALAAITGAVGSGGGRPAVVRVRAPERMSESAAADFLRAVLGRELSGREELLARAKELSLELAEGASMIVARAHPLLPADEGWRGRVRSIAERGARGVVSRS